MAAVVSLADDFRQVEMRWMDLPPSEASVFMSVAANDVSALAAALSANAALVNVEDEDDDSLLHAACARGYTELASLLLDCGAELNGYGCSSRTALMCAVIEGHAELAMFLLSRGASLVPDDSLDENVVHKAAVRGNAEFINVVASHRQRRFVVNHRNVLGSTPLHSAADFGETSCARLLVAAGADIHCKDYFGYTPLAIARNRGQLECVEFLTSAMQSLDSVDDR